MVAHVTGSKDAGCAGSRRIALGTAVDLQVAILHLQLAGENIGIGLVADGDKHAGEFDIGATAIVVSSHGGRQLDGVTASIDVLSDIVQAVGDRCEVILDSGIRRGTHILKALALGAKACTIGRPYLYGLAAGGEAGVDRALNILRDELERGMALMGCRRLSDLKQNHIRRRLP